MNEFIMWESILFCVGLAAFFIYGFKEAGSSIVGSRVTNKVRVKLYKSLLAKDIAWYDN